MQVTGQCLTPVGAWGEVPRLPGTLDCNACIDKSCVYKQQGNPCVQVSTMLLVAESGPTHLPPAIPSTYHQPPPDPARARAECRCPLAPSPAAAATKHCYPPPPPPTGRLQRMQVSFTPQPPCAAFYVRLSIAHCTTLVQATSHVARPPAAPTISLHDPPQGSLEIAPTGAQHAPTTGAPVRRSAPPPSLPPPPLPNSLPPALERGNAAPKQSI